MAKHLKSRRRFIGWTFSLAAAGIATQVHSQEATFPSRPVKLIVTSAVGGSGDLMARLVADKLAAAWGQAVVVDQKTGANGMVGTLAAMNAPADGYTAFLSYTSLVQNLHILANPGYTLDSFVPVSMVANLPLVLGVSSNLPIKTVGELISYAKANDGSVSFGSSGVGSSGHLMGASLARLGNVKMIHVPYKGEAASFPDMASGRLTAHFGSIGFYAPQAASGKVRILAVASPQRLQRYPDIPTLSEAGYAGANLPGWAAVFLPAGTPAPIVRKFSDAVQKVIAQPETQNAIRDLGFEPTASSSEQLRQHVRLEFDRWGVVIKDPEIKLDR